MKEQIKKLINFFRIKNKKLRIANYVILVFCVIYFLIIVYPNFLFDYTFKYKKFNIYSTQPIGDSIKKVLDEAELKLSVSEINDESLTHNIYLCNNYNLYTFFAPFIRKSFASNSPVVNNIFIAKCDINKNVGYKNDEMNKYTRELSAIISHETTHTLIQKKIGFWKFITLSSWKNEGYCEYVGCGKTDNIKEGQEFLIKNNNDNKSGTRYRKFYIAVNYLMTSKKMTFDNILSTNLSLEEVLKKVELAK